MPFSFRQLLADRRQIHPPIKTLNWTKLEAMRFQIGVQTSTLSETRNPLSIIARVFRRREKRIRQGSCQCRIRIRIKMRIVIWRRKMKRFRAWKFLVLIPPKVSRTLVGDEAAVFVSAVFLFVVTFFMKIPYFYEFATFDQRVKITE